MTSWPSTRSSSSGKWRCVACLLICVHVREVWVSLFVRGPTDLTNQPTSPIL